VLSASSIVALAPKTDCVADRRHSDAVKYVSDENNIAVHKQFLFDQNYVGHCPLAEVYLTHATSQNFLMFLRYKAIEQRYLLSAQPSSEFIRYGPAGLAGKSIRLLPLNAHSQITLLYEVTVLMQS
jgi:hypothetical protein